MEEPFRISTTPENPAHTVPIEEPVVDDNNGKQKHNAPHLSLWELFVLFLGFGINAWGGAVAQIALIQDALVKERKWITPETFKRVYAVYQILPGPEAAELCCYFGYLSRGRVGALVAGLAFILPGFLAMLLFSYIYVVFGLSNKYFLASFKALQPIVAAMVLRAVHKIGEETMVNHETGILDRKILAFAVLAGLNTAVNINFFISLAVFGLATAAFGSTSKYGKVTGYGILLIAYAAGITYIAIKGLPSVSALGLGVARTPDIGHLSALGLVAGAFSFGGAYTSIPFVVQEAVVIGGWISQKVFLDGVALANVLPAPTVIFSTFVGFWGGYVGHDSNVGYGFAGAIVTTIGMFVPCFSFTIIGHNFFDSLVHRKSISSFLDGVSGSVVGIIAVTAVQLFHSSIVSAVSPLPGAKVDIQTASVNAVSSLMLYFLTLAVLYSFKDKTTNAVVVVVGAIAGQFLYLDNGGF
ncbi:chromate transporter [Chytriomyces cf. hyalinus JEL632]|nr:chromate transporter [Chytriomyces cf. hyalinus JEL632]